MSNRLKTILAMALIAPGGILFAGLYYANENFGIAFVGGPLFWGIVGFFINFDDNKDE